MTRFLPALLALFLMSSSCFSDTTAVFFSSKKIPCQSIARCRLMDLQCWKETLFPYEEMLEARPFSYGGNLHFDDFSSSTIPFLKESEDQLLMDQRIYRAGDSEIHFSTRLYKFSILGRSHEVYVPALDAPGILKSYADNSTFLRLDPVSDTALKNEKWRWPLVRVQDGELVGMVPAQFKSQLAVIKSFWVSWFAPDIAYAVILKRGKDSLLYTFLIGYEKDRFCLRDHMSKCMFAPLFSLRFSQDMIEYVEISQGEKCSLDFSLFSDNYVFWQAFEKECSRCHLSLK